MNGNLEKNFLLNSEFLHWFNRCDHYFNFYCTWSGISASLALYPQDDTSLPKKFSKSNSSTDFHEIFLKCVFTIMMIPIVLAFVQIRAERMAFHQPIVMTTVLCSQAFIHFKIYWNVSSIVLNTYAQF